MDIIKKISPQKGQKGQKAQKRKVPLEKHQNGKIQAHKTFIDEGQADLQILQELFLEFLTHTKKLSPHSLRAYKKDLESLLSLKTCPKAQAGGKKISACSGMTNSAERTGPDLSQSGLCKNGLKRKFSKKNSQDQKKLEWEIKSLAEKNINKNRGWKNSTRSRKLASLRTFIKWLAQEKYLKEDFRHLFKSPKVSSPIPFFLSVDEALVIIDMFQKKNSVPAEDKALFSLIYGGGLRVSEACHLKNKNINWHHRTLKIKGKGGRERMVFLPEYAFSFLSAVQTNQTYFFGAKALSERKAYDKIKRIGRLAGLSKTLHPHALRHSFATHMLTGGSEIRVLQELLGHKSLTATQKYTHLDLACLDKTLEDFHPLNEELDIL